MRGRLIAASGLLWIASYQPVWSQQRRFDVAAQSLSSAINLLGKQAGIQILASRTITDGIEAKAVRGDMSVDAALQRLLRGTGLVARRIGGATFVVLKATDRTGHAAEGAPAATEEAAPIVVTGSRIPTTSTAAVIPSVRPVSSRSLRERGATNVASVINLLPQSGMPESPRGEQGENVGRNYINLFGLGSQRTLTLVNGRRFVTGNPAAAGTVTPGNQVDLNNIPADLVDRIEIVPATGTAIYGTDAVAGVANIILKDHVEGLEITGQSGLAGVGDAASYRLGALLGGTFAQGKGKVTLSLEHVFSAGLVGKDRSIFSRGDIFARNPADSGRNDGIPATVLTDGRRIPELNRDGLPFTDAYGGVRSILTMIDPADPSRSVPARFSPGGNLVPYDVGTFFSTAVARGGDGYDLADSTTLLTQTRRDIAYAIGSFAFGEDLKLSVEASSARVRATQFNDQGRTFNSTLLPAPLNATRLSASNPFLSEQARSVLTAAGLDSFYLARANRDLPIDNDVSSRSRTSRIAVALTGTIPAGQSPLQWTLTAVGGRSDGTVRSYAIDTQRYLNAVDAVRAPDGSIACATTVANPTSSDPDIAGCAPLNLFGLGAPDAASRAYINASRVRSFHSGQIDLQATLGGELALLAAGPIAFSAGYEHRRENSSYRVNDAMASGRTRYGVTQAVRGSYATNELYAEMRVPVVGQAQRVPFVRSLTVDAGGRVARNSRAGSDQAWSVGAKWSPYAGILLQGSASRTFRTPSIVELFLPDSATLSYVAADPCDARNITRGSNPARRGANCAAMFERLGLPPDFRLASTAQNVAVPTLLGGNPDLRNEVANSWTAGVQIRPRFLPGLSIAADHLHISLRHAIVNFDAVAALAACFDASVPTEAICGLISRNDQAQITRAQTGYVNAGYTDYRAWTYRIDYRATLPRWIGGDDPGTLDIGVDALRTGRLETSVLGLGFDLDRTAGELNAPRWKGQLRVGYSKGPVSLFWSTNYIGPAAYDVTFTREDRDVLKVRKYFRHDAGVRLALPGKVELGFVVNNILNREPDPLSLSVQGTSGSYDPVGRTLLVDARTRF